MLSTVSLVNLSTARNCLKVFILGACVKYNFFYYLFPGQKLWEWLSYTSKDQRQNLVQDEAASRDVKTGWKRLN